MTFTYKAMTAEGRPINGTAEAASKQALLGLLRKQGVHPILIEAGSKKKFELFTPKKKVHLQELVIFTRQLSTMISAGVPLARSLSALQTDSANPYLSEILSSITKDVESGLPLGDAFERFPNVFSDVFVNMVRAGEEGGILDEILKRLATQVEQDASIRKRIKGAMAYPVVVLSFMVIAFFGIMLFIMPKISAIVLELGGPNAKLPVYSRVLLGFSNQCVKPTIVHKIPILNDIPLIKSLPNMLFFAVIVGIASVYVLRYIRTPVGKYKFHGLILRMPIVKTIVLKIAIARFSRTFASLMGAGVSVLDALDVTGKAIGNKVIEKELQDAAIEVKNGKQLSEPISQSKHFPPIVAQMLIVGEETGQVDTVLGKIADFYDEEVTVLIDGIAAVIEPVIIIILGAAVGLIAASVMGPIANLTKQIGNN
jgi:type IV pilus assembly protein PilC